MCINIVYDVDLIVKTFYYSEIVIFDKKFQMSMDKDHHLKYKGRLQYGLFLKGIGLSMEEAIR